MTFFDQEDHIDPNTDFLAELTKPGGKFDRTKYSSDEDMYKAIAKGKYEADHFIQSKNKQYDDLYTDHVQLREQINAGSSLQELLDQLQQQQDADRQHTPAQNDAKPAIDPDEIKNMFTSEYQKIRETEREENNLNSVMNRAKEVFGDNFKTSIKKQADALGMAEGDVVSMARRNPNLFYKTFDLNQKVNQNFQSPPQTQMRSDIGANRTDRRTLSYYEDLRKTKPDIYYDKKTVIQMDKDAQALGEEFFDI